MTIYQSNWHTLKISFIILTIFFSYLTGDGDPLDVVDIGIFPHRTGEVSFVKVIGAIGLIDEQETDWKVIAINVNDPKAHFINGL